MRIIITGAAGGIGAELTSHLINKNEIYAFSRSEKNLKILKQKIKNKNLKTFTLDVANKNQVKKAVSGIGQIDAVINCAAVLAPVGSFLENDLEEWKKTIEINLLGTVNVCYYTMPFLNKSRRGKIINFAGGGSAYPRLNHSAYSVSKTAVVRFTEDIALENPELDINSIAPGAHKTNMWISETFDKEPENWGDMKRLKNFIDFLISEESDGLTGKFIHYKDSWENFDLNKLGEDIYTLRRIEK
jgi:short-subunit dehydrogenase